MVRECVWWVKGEGNGIWRRVPPVEARATSRGRPAEGGAGRGSEMVDRTGGPLAGDPEGGPVGEGPGPGRADVPPDTDSGHVGGAADGSRGQRLRRVAAWVRGHGPHTLIGSVFVTVVGAVVSVLLGSALGGGGSEGGTEGARAGVGTAGASSAPGCSERACDGLDPRVTGCGDGAMTLKAGMAGTMRLEIRYSTACRTVWGKLTGAEVGDTVEIRTSPTRRQSDAIEYDHDVYTPMLFLPGAQDFGVQATAVAVNPKKREVKQGYELTVGAGPSDLPRATATATATEADAATERATDTATGATPAPGRAS